MNFVCDSITLLYFPLMRSWKLSLALGELDRYSVVILIPSLNTALRLGGKFPGTMPLFPNSAAEMLLHLISSTTPVNPVRLSWHAIWKK